MKRIRIFLALALAIMMMLCAVLPAMAVESTNQVTESGGTIYYNASGEPVNANALGGNAIVSVSKTATQHVSNGTPVENQFLVELQVRTTQDLTQLSSSSPDAAVTLILDVSSSMTECVVCGHKENENCHRGYNPTCKNFQGTGDKTRMDATKTAAKDFLDNFAALGMEDAGTDKPRRMVSVITFSEDAVLQQDFIDVAVAENLTSVKNTITNLQTSSGTNIEGGLQLANNIIANGRSNANEIQGVDYLYTILLTDGEPSMGMEPNANRNSTTRIAGSWDENFGNSYQTDYTDIDEVKPNTTAIRAFTNQSRLFSICLGSEVQHTASGVTNSTMSLKPFGNWSDLGTTTNTTVGEWLSSFSNAVYGDIADANASTILESFNSIMSQIRLAAEAWEVRDQMGPYIEYKSAVSVPDGTGTLNNTHSMSGDTLTWNLLQSDIDPAISSETDGILGYTFRYIVELDNLGSGYTAGTDTLTNTTAVLDYAIENPQTGAWTLFENKKFPEPEVVGYDGELSFKKVDENGKAISGMVFTLKSDDAPIGWQMTATSGNNGVVTFTGIPSGHAYRLDEQTTAHYEPIGDLPFTVEWGEAKIPADSLLSKVGNDYTLTNKIIVDEDSEIDLIVKKVFIDEEGNPLPDDVMASQQDAYAHFELSYPNNTTETFYLHSGNTYLNQFDGLATGIHTVIETEAPVEGYDLYGTHVMFEDSLDATANEAVSYSNHYAFNAERVADQTRTYTLTFTNVYHHRTGSVQLNKSFMVHPIGNSSESSLTPLLSGYSNVQSVIELYAASDLTTPIATKTLTGSDWSWDIEALPEGEYVIKEKSITGDVAGHKFVHGLFTSLISSYVTTTPGADMDTMQLSADAAQGLRFTVRDGYSYTIDLENHYVPHNAQIRAAKYFRNPVGVGGVDSAEDFMALYQALYPNADDPVIYVDIYRGKLAANEIAGSSALRVATLELRHDAWATISTTLPAGDYTIVERMDDMLMFPGFKVITPAPQYVTIGAASHGTVIDVQIENSYESQRGSLSVSKTVEHPVAADMVAHFNFTITLSDNRITGSYPVTYTGTNTGEFTNTHIQFNNGVAQLYLHHGNTATISNLPAGVTYTITETPAAGYAEVTSKTTGATGSIEVDKTASAAFVNERTVHGAVVLSKKVSSPLPGDLIRKFTFAVELYDADGTTPLTGTFGAHSFKEGKLVNEKGNEITLQLEHDDQYTFSALPVGAKIIFTEVKSETDSKDFTTTVNGAASNTIQITVPQNTSATATFINTRNRDGKLTISKTVVSDFTTDSEKAFDFTITLTDMAGKQINFSETVEGMIGSQKVNVEFIRGTATVSLKGGQSITITGLPEDVKYTVTEAAYAGFTTESTGTSGEITSTGATAAFTNTRASGVLVLRKHVGSDIEADQNLAFQFTIELNGAENQKLGNVQFNGSGKATVSLKHGESVAIPLPENSTGAYTITEADYPGFTTTHQIGGASATVQTGSVATDSFTASDVEVVLFTNTRKTGSFTVSKELVSDLPSDADKTFDFTVTIYKDEARTQVETDLDDPYGNMTFDHGVAKFTLKGGEWKTAVGLPAGTHYYAVVESADDDFNVQTANATGKIEEGTANSVEAVFTNTRKTGTLTLTKQVESTVHADHQHLFQFTITLNEKITKTFGGNVQTTPAHDDGFMDSTIRPRTVGFTDGVSEPIYLHHNQSLTIEGLPQDVIAVVSETAADGYTTTVNDNAQATISSAAMPVITFTNTRKTGTLSLTKVLSSNLAADLNRSFGFTVLLTGAHGGPISGDFAYTIDGGAAQTASFTADGLWGVQLKAGQTLTFSNLPIGAQYTITESEDPEFTQTTENATGTISAATGTATFTNTRKVTGLTIRKTVTGPKAASDPAEFTFLLTLLDASNAALTGEFTAVNSSNQETKFTLNAQGQTAFTLKDGEHITIKDLPQGAAYTVVETPHYPQYDLVVKNDTGALLSGGAYVSFENIRKTGGIKVEKHVDGTLLPGDPTEYSFVLELSQPITGNVTVKASNEAAAKTKEYIGAKEISVSVPANGYVEITGLPAGIDVTATEKTPEQFTATYVNNKNSASIISGNIAAIVCENQRKTGGLSVSKTVISDLADDAKTDFHFVLTLDGIGDVTLGGKTFDDGKHEFTLKHGETCSFTDLPTGTKYTVTEEKATGFVTTSQGETGTISANAAALAAFTNIRQTGVSIQKISTGLVDASAAYPVPTLSIYSALDASKPVWSEEVKPNEAPKALEIALPAGEYRIVETIIGVEDYSCATKVFINSVALTGDTFTVEAGESTIAIAVENVYTSEFDVSIRKEWTGDDEKKRPDSVAVRLMLNGKAIGEPVALSAANEWKYTWKAIHPSDGYTVEEVNVPKGYIAQVTKEDEQTFLITNCAEKALTDLPETGDRSNPFVWFCLLAASVIGLAAIKRTKRSRNNA